MNRKATLHNLILLIVTIIVVGGFFVASRKIDNENKGESYRQPDYIYNDEYYIKKDNIRLVLFVGLDSYDSEVEETYRNNDLADALVLLVLNQNNKTILPIQISRDTMCNYHTLGIGGKYIGDEYGQIALAHSYGTGGLDSLVNEKDAVSDLLTGIRIDDYLSLTMNAIPIINDDCGGIEVFVEDDFSNVDDSLIMGETNLLMGEHALTFIRSRMGLADPSNINRMNRQRVYLKALYNKCKDLVKQDNDFIAKTFNDISAYLVASTDIYGLSDLGNLILSYDVLDSVKLESKQEIGEDGYVQDILDEEAKIDFCLNTFYNKMEH